MDKITAMQLSSNYATEVFKTELEEIYSLIETAARNGKWQVNLEPRLSNKDLITYLQQKGFSPYPCFNTQSSTPGTTIYWGDE